MKNKIPKLNNSILARTWNRWSFKPLGGDIYQVESKFSASEVLDIPFTELAHMEYSKWAEIRTQYLEFIDMLHENFQTIIDFHNLSSEEWGKRPIIELHGLYLLWKKNTRFYEL